MKDIEQVKNILLKTFKDEFKPYALDYHLEVTDNKLASGYIHVSLTVKGLGLHEDLSLLWMIHSDPRPKDNWGHKICANALILNIWDMYDHPEAEQYRLQYIQILANMIRLKYGARYNAVVYFDDDFSGEFSLPEALHRMAEKL